jgi:hypothetical protein
MNVRTLFRRRASLVPVLAGATLLAASLRADGPDIRAKISAPSSLGAGGRGTVTVEMTLGSGWHVNSHKPSEDFLIPTNLTLSAAGGTLSAVRYPKDIERSFAFSEKPLKVYEGTVRFEAELSVPAGAAGKVAVTGTLSYQACNDQQCFPPAKLPLEASVPVTKR